MNKLILPSILAAVLVVAAFYAFVPIEKVSAVHSTLQTNLQNTQINNVADQVSTACSSNLKDDLLTATSDKDFIIFYQITATSGARNVKMSTEGITLFLAIPTDTTTTGMLAFPGGSTTTFQDITAGGTRADGCATVITEAGGTGSVT